MPELPENDPVVSKSYALHYAVAMVLLIASLFWALWDEAYGQRPWKHVQNEFKDRYAAFLGTVRGRSEASVKDIEGRAEFQKLRSPGRTSCKDC